MTTDAVTTNSGTTNSGTVGAGGRGARRVVLWASLAVGLVVAVLVVVFATAGTPSDTSRIVGRAAPAISGRDLAGGPDVSLASYAGRWVLVDFGASTCVDCREELPELERFAATAGRYHAAILTVEQEPGDGPSLARYMADNHAHWPVIADPVASVDYGVTGIPSIYLVDPAGIVAGYYPSGIEPATVDASITAAITRRS